MPLKYVCLGSLNGQIIQISWKKKNLSGSLDIGENMYILGFRRLAVFPRLINWHFPPPGWSAFGRFEFLL